jgi:glycosyltransferase involved in cell wall biosynthesis
VISVVIPAYGEEKNLRDAVASVLGSAERTGIRDLEILIVNDGSRDRTGEVAEDIARQTPGVVVIHHPRNLGIGQSFLDGVKAARHSYVTLFPGDNGNAAATTDTLFRSVGKADVVATFVMNTEVRGWPRFVLSTLYTFIYVATFGIHLKYINGSALYPTRMLKDLKLRSRGYSMLAEINVKLLRKGLTFIEFGSWLNPDGKKSSAIRIKNFFEVLRSYFALVSEIYFLAPREYSRLPRRVQDGDPVAAIPEGARSLPAHSK